VFFHDVATQLLDMRHDLPTEEQDHEDPATCINTDTAQSRQTSFDTLTGKATK
jgi:hypothetical protein